MTPQDRLRDSLIGAMRAGSMVDALRILNDRVPHRFTGIYQLRDGMLTNIGLFDKHGEVLPAALAVVPLDISFCQFVFRDQFFRTDNSSEDHRLDGHRFQGVVLAYHGVPLVNDAGELYGSLCHFDLQAWDISDDEFSNLQLAAMLMPPFLPRG